MNISKEIRKKAYLFFKKRKVRKEIETEKRIHFKVQGRTSTYSVIFDKEKNRWECDCLYSTLKNKECSHIAASKLLKGNLR